jgi:hypothetical protein
MLHSEKVVHNANSRPFKSYNHTFVSIDGEPALKVGVNMKLAGLNPAVLHICQNTCTLDQLEPQDLLDADKLLFSTTDYHKTLLPPFYPLKDNEAVYAPKVNVTTENAALAMVTCAALSSTASTTDLKDKLELVLFTAFQKGHDSIVLSPFSKDSAAVTKELVDMYSSVFKYLSISIVDEDTLCTFRQVFC